VPSRSAAPAWSSCCATDDGDAAHCLGELLELLVGVGQQVTTAELERLISRYEFEDALQVLLKLQQNLAAEEQQS